MTSGQRPRLYWLPDEDEAGPQNRMFSESRGSRFRLDADAAASNAGAISSLMPLTPMRQLQVGIKVRF